MIDGHKVIAHTPCGRRRFMDILAAYMKREHDAEHIDEWVLFRNAYCYVDDPIIFQYAEKFPWVTILDHPQVIISADPPQNTTQAPLISRFYPLLARSVTDDEAVYIRFDDDICYVHEDAVPRLVRWRLTHRAPFLVYPLIINNTRTSYHLQQAGKVTKDWGTVTNDMGCNIGCHDEQFSYGLHMMALDSVEAGKVVEDFSLPSREFTNYDDGRISVNCFAIMGKDLKATRVHPDEESYFSWWRPEDLGRFNARCGDAIVVHFSFGGQNVCGRPNMNDGFMSQTGLLTDWGRLAPPLGFRTRQAPATVWPPKMYFIWPGYPIGWSWDMPQPDNYDVHPDLRSPCLPRHLACDERFQRHRPGGITQRDPSKRELKA